LNDYHLYWGDSHANLHHHHINEEQLASSLNWAKEILDFWPLAYYPMAMYPIKSFVVEDWRSAEEVDHDWKMICELAAKNDSPGKFVIFPGYEWQGDGTSGDHNVFFLEDYPPLIRCSKLRDLYDEIRRRNLKAFAIPHHCAYIPGVRSKDWDVHDEEISPFAEIFSVHGCSESDEEWIGLRSNRNMGPGCSGGTIVDGLNRGYKFGIICSNDSHEGLSGVHGWGLMAAYAKELTRQSLWEAFTERRVYGVSGDRIELDFTVDSAPMGAVIRKRGPVRTLTRVRCTDALDRIELLRNNRLIATHCHDGTWDIPTDREGFRCKLRVEVGWNTSPKLIPDRPPIDWQCEIKLTDGKIVSAEKCWKTVGQWLGRTGGSRCEFGFHTLAEHAGGLHTEATVFELETTPNAQLTVDIRGKTISTSVAEGMRRSRIVHFMEENADFVKRTYGLDPWDLPRNDRLYYLGPKAKIHRIIPENGFVGELDFVDDNPPAGTNHYRVRVTQRNGQVAWSSPIWVENN